MAIKNKDGTVYTIRGPNPLMKEQSNFKEFVLHNFKWDVEVSKASTPPVVPVETDFNIEKLEEEVPRESQEEKIEIVEKLKKSESSPTDPNITRIHCLPMNVEKKTDDFYGETRTINKWGDPFLFEAVILDENDFKIVFWTNIDIIHKGSIVYPANKDKRWWKVNQMKEKDGGYLYDGYLSDIHPDFS